MKQNYNNYKEEDFLVWKTLFERQVKNLQDKSCKAYLDCLYQLSEVLNADEIPRFDALNEVLKAKTGWTVAVVPGLIPVDEFFNLLANKQFCSSTWLRKMEQLDYLEEPDMFHDIFGHIPLFMNQGYADFAHQMGLLGQQFSGNEKVLLELQRIYWFTIEFGLIQENGLKLYGAGIMSSFGESNFVYSDKPELLPFNLEEVIATDFCNSEIQTKYFVIDSFEQLFEAIIEYSKRLAVTVT
jgi:phenylalanine-4-hydroxylase